jgi:hypothetical protein
MNSSAPSRFVGLLLLLFMGAGCSSMSKPGLPLKDANLAEGPVLIQRGEHFYLRYRRALDDEHVRFCMVLDAKKTKEAGYYFFVGPVSFPEWGNLVERPLAYDDLEKLALAGQIYWLDPDETRHLIPVRREE